MSLSDGVSYIKETLAYESFRMFPKHGSEDYFYRDISNGLIFYFNTTTCTYDVISPANKNININNNRSAIDLSIQDKIKESQSTGAGGKKDDAGKLQSSLLIPKFINGIIRVLEFGLIKYEKNSWQFVPAGETRYFDALKRHWDAMIKDDGTIDLDSRDEESGLPHLWHLQCNAYFLELFRIKQTQKEKQNENA